MVTIKFFSLIREALETEQMTVELPEGQHSVHDLKSQLLEASGPHWREILFQPNVVHAVNQRVVDPQHLVCDGDEVALFPPMTGG